MKLTKRVKKLLAGTLVAFVLMTMFSCQHQKIKALEEQANIKQEIGRAHVWTPVTN